METTVSRISDRGLRGDVLAGLRAPRWRRIGVWSRGVGIALVGLAAFAPIPPLLVAVLGLPGLALFTFGALVWLSRDAESWRR